MFWNHLRSVGPHQHRLAVSSSPVITSAVSPPQPSPPAAAGTASRRLLCPRWGVWPASPLVPRQTPAPRPSPVPISLTGRQPPGPSAQLFSCPVLLLVRLLDKSLVPRAHPAVPRLQTPPRTCCFPGQRITRVPGPAASFHTHQNIRCPHPVLKPPPAHFSCSLPSPTSPQVPCPCCLLSVSNPHPPDLLCCLYFPLRVCSKRRLIRRLSRTLLVTAHSPAPFYAFLLLHLPEWCFSRNLRYAFTHFFIFHLVFRDASPEAAATSCQRSTALSSCLG